MSGWFLMDTATGGWIEGPLTEAREDGEWREVPAGWPDTVRWDEETRAFIEKPPPMSDCARLTALLVAKGIFTQAEADAL